MQKNDEVLDAGQLAIAQARGVGVRIGFGSDLMGELEDEQLGGLRLQSEVRREGEASAVLDITL